MALLFLNEYLKVLSVWNDRIVQFVFIRFIAVRNSIDFQISQSADEIV